MTLTERVSNYAQRGAAPKDRRKRAPTDNLAARLLHLLMNVGPPWSVEAARIVARDDLAGALGLLDRYEKAERERAEPALAEHSEA